MAIKITTEADTIIVAMITGVTTIAAMTMAITTKAMAAPLSTNVLSLQKPGATVTAA
jgi:hypothetical protein